MGTGQKSTGDTLARCDTLARSEILAQKSFCNIFYCLNNIRYCVPKRS